MLKQQRFSIEAKSKQFSRKQSKPVRGPIPTPSGPFVTVRQDRRNRASARAAPAHYSRAGRHPNCRGDTNAEGPRRVSKALVWSRDRIRRPQSRDPVTPYRGDLPIISAGGRRRPPLSRDLSRRVKVNGTPRLPSRPRRNPRFRNAPHGRLPNARQSRRLRRRADCDDRSGAGSRMAGLFGRTMRVSPRRRVRMWSRSRWRCAGDYLGGRISPGSGEALEVEHGKMRWCGEWIGSRAEVVRGIIGAGSSKSRATFGRNSGGPRRPLCRAAGALRK